MTTLAFAAGAVSQSRRFTVAPPSPPPPPTTTRSSYPNTSGSSSAASSHERGRNNRPKSTPTATTAADTGTRTSITALPTIGTCLHKLPYLSPEDAQPLIAHNSSPRSDEGIRESMLFDALATTQRARRSSHGSSSLAATTTNAAVGSPTPMPELYLGTEPPTTGCIACNSAIASHLPLPLSSHEGVGVHLVVPSPPRSPAPSASSSRSRSRPSSIASNSSRKIFSLTPLDAASASSTDHRHDYHPHADNTTEDTYFCTHHQPRSPAFTTSSFEKNISSFSSSDDDHSHSHSDSDSDSESEDDEGRYMTRMRSRRSSTYSAYSPYSSDGSGGVGSGSGIGGGVGGRAGRMSLRMSKIPSYSKFSNATIRK